MQMYVSVIEIILSVLLLIALCVIIFKVDLKETKQVPLNFVPEQVYSELQKQIHILTSEKNVLSEYLKEVLIAQQANKKDHELLIFRHKELLEEADELRSVLTDTRKHLLETQTKLVVTENEFHSLRREYQQLFFPSDGKDDASDKMSEDHSEPAY